MNVTRMPQKAREELATALENIARLFEEGHLQVRLAKLGSSVEVSFSLDLEGSREMSIRQIQQPEEGLRRLCELFEDHDVSQN